MSSEPTQGGELKNGPTVPFIQIVMKGFVGQPVAARVEFSPQELFDAPDAGAIIRDAYRNCIMACLRAADQANIWLLKDAMEMKETR